jgi:hypothetical protein
MEVTQIIEIRIDLNEDKTSLGAGEVKIELKFVPGK